MTPEISISNVGGIESLEASFEEGVTLVAAPNASNKTSLLKAIAFALGADEVPIRSGTTEASVVLTLDGRTVTRTATRHGVGKRISGDPWLEEDATERFEAVCALLEFNALRTAVRQGENVETALKSPIDFDALEREQSQLLREKQSLTTELEQLGDVDDRFETVTAELADARDRRETLETRLNELQTAREESAPDDELQALRDRRTDLLSAKEETLERISAVEDAIERHRSERTELEEHLAALEADRPTTDVEALREERDQLQRDLESLVDKVDVLQSVLTANREMLSSEFTGVVDRHHDISGDTVACWTCGSPAPVSEIEEMLSELQEVVEAEKRRKRDQEPRIEELDMAIQEARRTESELEQLRAERRRTDQRIEDRQESLATQSARLEELDGELDEVTAELEAAQRASSEQSDELTSSIEEVRVEKQVVEREIGRLESQREELDTQQERKRQLETEIEQLSDEIASITERLETMEERLRARFNEAMDDLLVALDFDGIARIWLDGEFEVIVAREVEGSVQRDSVGNLAESERELVGLVLGFAGYEAYELANDVPVVLLDSLGSLDNDRVERLIDYIRDAPKYLVAAAHPDTADSMGTDNVSLLRSPLVSD